MPRDLHDNDPRFVEYYARESGSAAAAERAQRIMDAVLRVRGQRGFTVRNLTVADIGCNAGTQSRVWLEGGHTVRGLDISKELVSIARVRNSDFSGQSAFEVGSATRIPWSEKTFDVCLLPELLEHVDDWQACLSEAVRILKPGGTMYLSTTNVLCPIQQEFNLPLFSWYPRWLKKRFLQQSVTNAPHLVNFATHPAYHWFSPYSLSRWLRGRDVYTLDRFDVIDTAGKSRLKSLVVSTVKAVPLLRLAGHVMTPYTMLIGVKLGG